MQKHLSTEPVRAISRSRMWEDLQEIPFHYADAKISLGYRGDFFFGAMDTGIDVRKSTTLGYFGPYASLSVGVGD